MRHSGLRYFLNEIGVDTGAYRLHYRFDVSGSGQKIPNEANYPQHSGFLSAIGTFYAVSGSGWFSGQSINIGNAENLPSDAWGHLFIYEKTGFGGGVIFDSFIRNPISSGYSFGLTESNRLYFQYSDANYPILETSNLMLGDKNLVCITKGNNTISFYNYDFSEQEIFADEKTINGNYCLPSNKANIAQSLMLHSGFGLNKPFSGYLSEYVILDQRVSPSIFRYLASGLVSDYFETRNIIASGQINQITGYISGLTGVTGVTGYANVITGSGLDPFSTGEYIYYYQNVGLTGYLTTGLKLTPQTGNMAFYITGDVSGYLIQNTGLIYSFGYDELSYLRKIDHLDISLFRVPQNTFLELNQLGLFDDVTTKFQTKDIYTPEQISLFFNGICQLYTGYSVTGNIYGSGIVISGDFVLDGFYINTTGFYNGDDVAIYDAVSGKKTAAILTGVVSGAPVLINKNSHIFFLNGQALISGLDYEIVSNNFVWKRNDFSGVSGVIFGQEDSSHFKNITGIFFNNSLRAGWKQNQLFLNGQRQLHQINYLPNSKFDLIKQSGIFEGNLSQVFNNETAYFE